MKNLFTLLLLVISPLAIGQTNNTSEEIKYWKSIMDSNDTVAYRQYLNRYGETGLYKDEAYTRIILIKTSGKQVQSRSIQCFFYYNDKNDHIPYLQRRTVVRFNDNQDTVWLKATDYDTIRSNLAISKDFYENQATIAVSRGTRKYYKNAWTTDEVYEYDPMKSTSARDVYFKRDKLHKIDLVFYRTDAHNTFFVYSGDRKNDEYFKENANLLNIGRYEIIKSIQGYSYIAFTKNKSSYIMWFEEDVNLDGKIFEKRYYNRVSKEELLPKAVKYDFLNE